MVAKYQLNADKDGQAGSASSSEAGRTIDGESLRFLRKYAGPYRYRLTAAVATAVPIAALGGVMAWAVKKVVEYFSSGGSGKEALFWLIAGLVGVVVRGVLEVVNRQILISIHAGIEKDMRLDLYETIHNSPLDFHTHVRTGEIANLIGNDVQFAAGGVVEIYSALWRHPAVIVCLTGVMFYFNPLLSIMGIILFPVLGACVGAVGRRAGDAERRFMEKQGRMMGSMVESLTNIREVKAFGRETGQRGELAKRCDELIASVRRVVLLKSMVWPATETLSGVTIGMMALVAYFQLKNGTTTAGSIAGCLAATVALKKPVKAVSAAAVQLQRAFAAIRRIRWVEEAAAEGRGGKSLDDPVNSVVLQDLTFSYDGRTDILKNVSVEMKRGERIAVIGASGAGKTSLLDLVTGFYPCRSGSLLVNGTDIRKIDLKSLRKRIGVVSQAPLLFDASIEDNIRYGNPDAESGDISRAVKAAGCSEMLERLPDGINTTVGEGGRRLSGGERKRVALARALARPLSVLLLDEVTSELDLCTAESILEVIDSLAGDMLIINVSHSDLILSHCDRALSLENGFVSEVSPGDILRGRRNTLR